MTPDPTKEKPVSDHKRLICTVGLPRSGKTTWALAFAQDHGCPIVNPDSVRLAVHGQRFIALAEPFVWATAKAMLRSLFLAGHDTVIVDATNVSRKRRDEWRSLDWQTLFYVIETSRDECLKRAADDPEIQPVIDRMANEWEPLGPDEIGVTPLGATGEFPQGALDPSEDEGAIRIAVAADKKSGVVRIEFGKPVAWLGLPKNEASQWAESIRWKASQL